MGHMKNIINNNACYALYYELGIANVDDKSTELVRPNFLHMVGRDVNRAWFDLEERTQTPLMHLDGYMEVINQVITMEEEKDKHAYLDLTTLFACCVTDLKNPCKFSWRMPKCSCIN